jgi:hypothetical protein
MEESVQDSQESVVESTSAPAETTTPVETAAPNAEKIPGSELVTSAAPAAPIFQPNFKFSTYGKEHEVPESFRQLIKDAETEKQVKEIFEKAYGLDGMKPKYQKLQERAQNFEKTINEEYQPLRGHFDQLNKYISNDDFDSLFEVAQIPLEKLQKWMYQKLTAAELPPEQRAVYDREAELRKRSYALEAENQSLKAKVEAENEAKFELQTQTIGQELESALSQPEVKSLADAYQAKTGKSLREVVITFARAKELETGVVTPVSEAVEAVLGLVGAGLNPSASQQKQAAPAAPQVTAQQKPPVIPNLTGKSTSPTVSKIKSVEDIKKRRDSLALESSN